VQEKEIWEIRQQKRRASLKFIPCYFSIKISLKKYNLGHLDRTNAFLYN
jgi:hypothetical protein